MTLFVFQSDFFPLGHTSKQRYWHTPILWQKWCFSVRCWRTGE